MPLRKSLKNKPFFDQYDRTCREVLSQTPTTVIAEEIPVFLRGTPANFFKRCRTANFFADSAEISALNIYETSARHTSAIVTHRVLGRAMRSAPQGASARA
jgi:hypothetical protein